MSEVKDKEISPAGHPSPEELCLKTPLYRKLELLETDMDWLNNLREYSGALDMYCRECRRDTVFSGPRYISVIRGDRLDMSSSEIFSLDYKCSRNAQHKAQFVYSLYRGALEKIGQHPSMADIDAPEIHKYRPILGAQGVREFIRGIGLVSHGVGAGAMVYLRRIFERLIDNASKEANKNKNWDQEKFARSRMDEKISMLKNLLPEFLVQNRSIYSVMSAGVHELDDDQCLAIFPVIKVSIELILDDELEKHHRKKKIEEATKSLSSVTSALKTKDK